MGTVSRRNSDLFPFLAKVRFLKKKLGDILFRKGRNVPKIVKNQRRGPEELNIKLEYDGAVVRPGTGGEHFGPGDFFHQAGAYKEVVDSPACVVGLGLADPLGPPGVEASLARVKFTEGVRKTGREKV